MRVSEPESKLSSMTDAELATLSQQGNAEAFGELARRWEGYLYRFARRMLGNDEDARDTCQDALLKAYLNIRRLRDPGRFRAWLHYIALNLCRDRHRSAGNRAVQTYQEGGAEEIRIIAANSCPAPDRRVERASLAEALAAVLGRLSLEQRTAILLREYQGFTSEEIAQITGVPAATVRTRIFYGLKSMRKMLGEYGISDADLLGGDEKR